MSGPQRRGHGSRAVCQPLSPRPNPIGLSTVRLNSIDGTRLDISGIDVLDRTPLLDIKPLFKGLDLKEDVNNGWRDRS